MKTGNWQVFLFKEGDKIAFYLLLAFMVMLAILLFLTLKKCKTSGEDARLIRKNNIILALAGSLAALITVPALIYYCGFVFSTISAFIKGMNMSVPFYTKLAMGITRFAGSHFIVLFLVPGLFFAGIVSIIYIILPIVLKSDGFQRRFHKFAVTINLIISVFMLISIVYFCCAYMSYTFSWAPEDIKDFIKDLLRNANENTFLLH